MARPGQYLHRPDNTSFWYVRFVYPWLPDEPKGRTIKHSLKTRVKAEAELLKLPHVARHLKTLAWIESSKRNSDDTRQCTTLRQKIPDGVHELPGGLTVTVRSDTCDYVAEDGSTWTEHGNIREIPIPGLFLTRADYESRAQEDALFDAEYGDYDCPGWRDAPTPVPTGPGKRKANDAAPAAGRASDRNPDDEIIRVWSQKPTKRREPKDRRTIDEAWDSWMTFQKLTGGKALRDCTRADGRALAKHFRDEGNKSGTVLKKISHLRAAVEIAIGDGLLTFNPFSSVVEMLNDADTREPVTDEEMAVIRANLDRFDPEERLLYLLCATTGMRLSEAYEIEREHHEKGIRYVIVGKKTPQSRRRVPLPEALLPFLPKKITGPMFVKSAKNLGRETNRAIRKMGVKKTIHCLRHRAKDRLRAEKVKLDMQYEILGHETKTVAAGYGNGYPVTDLKPIIDLIGY